MNFKKSIVIIVFCLLAGCGYHRYIYIPKTQGEIPAHINASQIKHFGSDGFLQKYAMLIRISKINDQEHSLPLVYERNSVLEFSPGDTKLEVTISKLGSSVGSGVIKFHFNANQNETYTLQFLENDKVNLSAFHMYQVGVLDSHGTVISKAMVTQERVKKIWED